MRLSSFWWPLTWALVIFVLMVIPVPPTPRLEGFNLFDKAVHLALFGPLAFLLGHYFAGNSPDISYATVFFKVMLAATAYGIFTEGFQALLPFRSAEARDVLADALGAGAGSAAFVLWHKFRFRKKKM